MARGEARGYPRVRQVTYRVRDRLPYAGTRDGVGVQIMDVAVTDLVRRCGDARVQRVDALGACKVEIAEGHRDRGRGFGGRAVRGTREANRHAGGHSGEHRAVPEIIELRVGHELLPLCWLERVGSWIGVGSVDRVASWCMRLLNARGAKVPRRVLIPVIDGSVPRRSGSASSGYRRRQRTRRVSPHRELRGYAGVPRALAGGHAGSSLRPTISSLFCEPTRTATAL